MRALPPAASCLAQSALYNWLLFLADAICESMPASGVHLGEVQRIKIVIVAFCPRHPSHHIMLSKHCCCSCSATSMAGCWFRGFGDAIVLYGCCVVCAKQGRWVWVGARRHQRDAEGQGQCSGASSMENESREKDAAPMLARL